MTHATHVTLADPVMVDFLGTEIRDGDRIWLVALAADGFRRLAGGVVVHLEDDRIWWLDDGCRLHASVPHAVKVVARSRASS